MNIDQMSDLPNWDDSRFSSLDEEGEEWRPNPTREACKVLYRQWQQVMFLLKGVLLPIIEQKRGTIEAEMDIDMGRELHGDAYRVGAKIISSEAGNIYILRMQNASIIRELAQRIASGLLTFEDEKAIDLSHVVVIRDEITKFRLLFIEWVKTFEKDEYVDEWGLFV